MANDRELALEQLKVGFSLMQSAASKDLPLGAFALADWESTLAAMKEYQALETDKKAADFFSNDYLPEP
jgi:hypothetical protein